MRTSSDLPESRVFWFWTRGASPGRRRRRKRRRRRRLRPPGHLPPHTSQVLHVVTVTTNGHLDINYVNHLRVTVALVR